MFRAGPKSELGDYSAIRLIPPAPNRPRESALRSVVMTRRMWATMILLADVGLGAMVRAPAGVGPRLSGAPARCGPLTMSDEGEQTEEGEAADDASTDWDSAWQQEVAKRKTGTAGWRPEGRAPPTEAELARVRAERAVSDAQGQVLGTLGEWNKSWVFWIGVIAIISLLTAAAGQHAPIDPDQFAVV